MLSLSVQSAVPKGHHCPFCAGLCSQQQGNLQLFQVQHSSSGPCSPVPQAAAPTKHRATKTAILPHSPAGLKNGNSGWAAKLSFLQTCHQQELRILFIWPVFLQKGDVSSTPMLAEAQHC